MTQPASSRLVTEATGQVVLRWDAATRTWPDRGAQLPFGVIFNSSNDPTATQPTDLDIRTGDEWVKHPSAA